MTSQSLVEAVTRGVKHGLSVLWDDLTFSAGCSVYPDPMYLGPLLVELHAREGQVVTLEETARDCDEAQ